MSLDSYLERWDGLGMKASSKWTKWQIGFVSAMIVVYLFQEVKESPEFLTAVREASKFKLNASTIVTQKKTDTQDQLNRTDVSFAQPQHQQTQQQAKPHTRSHAS